MNLQHRASRSILLLGLILLVTACASVKMADKAVSDAKHSFPPPSAGKAGVYIYRNSGVIGALQKKDLWIDGRCLGESAPNVFFYAEVEGNKQHIITTESELSTNPLELHFEAGKNYFIHQWLRVGVLASGAYLELVSEDQGKQAVSQMRLAQSGHCS